MFSRFQYLTTSQDLNNFIQKADDHIGVRFPLDYLMQNKVLGYFDGKGELIGGVAFIIKAPFRVAESLPEEGIQRLQTAVPDVDNDLFEITALWLKKSERGKASSIFFWLAIYRAVLKLGRPHFIYAYSSSKPKLGKIYSVCDPVEVYRGVTQVLPGMKDIDHEVVEIGSVRAVNRALFMKPGFLITRALRPVGRRKQRREVQATASLAHGA